MAAQERGEVAKRGEQDRVRDSARGSGIITPVTLPDIGIPRQRAAEMKKLAAAGTATIRAEVDMATADFEAVAGDTMKYHMANVTRGGSSGMDV